jgi:hypothetical protein
MAPRRLRALDEMEDERVEVLGLLGTGDEDVVGFVALGRREVVVDGNDGPAIVLSRLEELKAVEKNAQRDVRLSVPITVLLLDPIDADPRLP